MYFHYKGGDSISQVLLGKFVGSHLKQGGEGLAKAVDDDLSLSLDRRQRRGGLGFFSHPLRLGGRQTFNDRLS